MCVGGAGLPTTAAYQVQTVSRSRAEEEWLAVVEQTVKSVCLYDRITILTLFNVVVHWHEMNGVDARAAADVRRSCCPKMSTPKDNYLNVFSFMNNYLSRGK